MKFLHGNSSSCNKTCQTPSLSCVTGYGYGEVNTLMPWWAGLEEAPAGQAILASRLLYFSRYAEPLTSPRGTGGKGPGPPYHRRSCIVFCDTWPRTRWEHAANSNPFWGQSSQCSEPVFRSLIPRLRCVAAWIILSMVAACGGRAVRWYCSCDSALIL